MPASLPDPDPDPQHNLERESPTPEIVLEYRTPDSGESRWETLRACANAIEANLLMLKLQDSGLQARVDFENVGALGAWAGASPAGTKVQVLAGDFEKAREILEQIDRRREARKARAKMHCPRCGAEARHVSSFLRTLGAIFLMLGFAALFVRQGVAALIGLCLGIGLLLWPLTARWRCLACGHKWKAPDPSLEDDSEDEDLEGVEDNNQTR